MNPALNEERHAISRMRNNVRRSFYADLSFRSCQEDTRRLAAYGEELAKQVHDSMYTADDLARFIESGEFVMRNHIDVKVTNSNNIRALNGVRFDRLVLNGMRPFALDFDMLTLDATSELGGYVDDRLTQLGMVTISAATHEELQAVQKVDLQGCNTPLDVLQKLATVGQMANQLAFDMFTTGSAFTSPEE